jgi:hypothetical protein
MRSKRRPLLIAGLLALAGVCVIGFLATRSDDGNSDVSDAWLALPPPATWTGSLPQTIPFVEVGEEHRNEAVKRLAYQPWIELQRDEVARLAAMVPTHPGRAFLVRALVLSAHTGAFTVELRTRSLYVIHGTVGRIKPAVERRALVVWLGDPPENLYVYMDSAL